MRSTDPYPPADRLYHEWIVQHARVEGRAGRSELSGQPIRRCQRLGRCSALHLSSAMFVRWWTTWGEGGLRVGALGNGGRVYRQGAQL